MSLKLQISRVKALMPTSSNYAMYRYISFLFSITEDIFLPNPIKQFTEFSEIPWNLSFIVHVGYYKILFNCSLECFK